MGMWLIEVFKKKVSEEQVLSTQSSHFKQLYFITTFWFGLVLFCWFNFSFFFVEQLFIHFISHFNPKYRIRFVL